MLIFNQTESFFESWSYIFVFAFDILGDNSESLISYW